MFFGLKTTIYSTYSAISYRRDVLLFYLHKRTDLLQTQELGSPAPLSEAWGRNLRIRRFQAPHKYDYIPSQSYDSHINYLYDKQLKKPCNRRSYVSLPVFC